MAMARHSHCLACEILIKKAYHVVQHGKCQHADAGEAISNNAKRQMLMHAY
jgi:hypothetical protein